MKKWNILMAAGVLAWSLAGCSNGAATENTAVSGQTEASAAESTERAAAETAGGAASSEAQTESANAVGGETEDTGANALVIYFSATGNTKAVAETLAEMQGADLFEIIPEDPYTAEDLDYNDKSSRTTAEQNDADARPAIAETIQNIDAYDVVYVGYPIWWADMPRIMYTFFDTYDLSGMTIAPFCTSGGSGLSGTPEVIAELEPEATVLDGAQIGSDVEGELSDWLAEIGLNEGQQTE